MKKEVIIENWKAIDAIEETIRKKTGDPEAGFNSDLFFPGKTRVLVIPVLYRKKGKGGWSKKRYEIMVEANFCPFTGEPLYKVG